MNQLFDVYTSWRCIHYTVIHMFNIIYTTHCACYLHIASIWSLSLLCIHAYHMTQYIYYYRSQPKQVLLEAVKLVDMEKELELELEN